MKRLYVASASQGNSVHLKAFTGRVLQVTDTYIFAPMLGFLGKENVEVRYKGLEACIWMIDHWAEVFVVYYEGVESQGIWSELLRAVQRVIPVAIFNDSNKELLRIRDTSVFSEFGDFTEWLNEL